MDRLLTTLDQHPDTKISIKTGIEGWQTGEIVLIIQGNGTVIVDNRRSGTEKRYTTQLENQRILAFGQFLAEHHVTRFSPAETSTGHPPGDVPVWFRIEEAGQTLYEAKLWHSQRYDNDDLDAILEYSDSLIEEITGGVLPFGKPAS